MCLQEERYQQIEYDNRLLLGRMSEIMKVGYLSVPVGLQFVPVCATGMVTLIFMHHTY